MIENNITLIQNENKELKEANCKLAKQIQELEKNFRIQSMKLDYKTMKDLDNQITESDAKLKKTNENIQSLEREIRENNFRLEYLETSFVKKVKDADSINVQNSQIFKFFKDHVIRSIEKREEQKLKNKILLEKIIILCKKLKKVQK